MPTQFDRPDARKYSHRAAMASSHCSGPRRLHRRRRGYVHVMVAEAWHGPRPDGLLVVHYYDDPDHPAATNLRYGTHAENAADTRRNHIARRGVVEHLSPTLGRSSRRPARSRGNLLRGSHDRAVARGVRQV